MKKRHESPIIVKSDFNPKVLIKTGVLQWNCILSFSHWMSFL